MVSPQIGPALNRSLIHCPLAEERSSVKYSKYNTKIFYFLKESYFLPGILYDKYYVLTSEMTSVEFFSQLGLVGMTNPVRNLRVQ